MIDWGKPLRTRGGAAFEIYNKDRRHGAVYHGLSWHPCYWRKSGKCFIGCSAHKSYDLINETVEAAFYWSLYDANRL